MKKIRNQMKNKLRSREGLSVVTVVLIVILVIAILLVLFIPGYLEHLRNAKMTYDVQSVSTAEDVAILQYLEDSSPVLATYYYDELSHSALPRSQIGTIQGYGRSDRMQNLREETGAKGVPCYPKEDGGAQLLAITIQNNQIINARWTGTSWSYWDYYYMTRQEREQLENDDWREMDRSSVLLAKRRAQAQYAKDYAKLIKKGEDPGEAIYNYDLLGDELWYDPLMLLLGDLPEDLVLAEDESELLGESFYASLPEKALVMDASMIPAYGMIEDAAGGILQIHVHGEEAAAEWVEGSHDA